MFFFFFWFWVCVCTCCIGIGECALCGSFQINNFSRIWHSFVDCCAIPTPSRTSDCIQAHMLHSHIHTITQRCIDMRVRMNDCRVAVVRNKRSPVKRNHADNSARTPHNYYCLCPISTHTHTHTPADLRISIPLLSIPTADKRKHLRIYTYTYLNIYTYTHNIRTLRALSCHHYAWALSTQEVCGKCIQQCTFACHTYRCMQRTHTMTHAQMQKSPWIRW